LAVYRPRPRPKKGARRFGIAIAPPPVEPRRPGKGGPEHTYLQELIKRWGEEKGFRAVVEEQIAGSRESIDIALYRGEQKIACEVSVTTPLEYEVGNVEKCLAAGFGTIAIVSLKKARLLKLGKLKGERGKVPGVSARMRQGPAVRGFLRPREGVLRFD
jgi:hypothetical protein